MPPSGTGISILYASSGHESARRITDYFKQQGCSVSFSTKSRETLTLLLNNRYDILAVGAQLEDCPGPELLSRAKNTGVLAETGIVAIIDSAPGSGGNCSLKEALREKLVFLNAGVDDCFTSGMDEEECLARIRNIVRRLPAGGAEEVIRSGDIELNLKSYTVRAGGRLVALTAKEFDLLLAFLTSQGRVLKRPYLIERVWGCNYFGSPRTVDVHIRRLRRKLGKSADCILTMPCLGYRFDPKD